MIVDLNSRPHRRAFASRARTRLWAKLWEWRTSFAVKFCGSRSRIERPAVLIGRAGIRIGDDVVVLRGARIEVFPREVTDEPILEIGDRVIIHAGSHIGAVHSVKIGSGVLMAQGCYITDHDHDWSDPFDPAIQNNRVTAEPVSIGDFVWLGERVMVLKGVRIGERSVIGAGSIVTRDVPPLSLAIGSPARVVKTWNPETKSWQGLGACKQ